MEITPDAITYVEIGSVRISATLFCTWFVMLLLTMLSWGIGRRCSHRVPLSRSAVVLETLVEFIHSNLAQTGMKNPEKYIPFVGTIFIFIAASGILELVPGFIPPTSSLSTTAALALLVFIAVPVYAITQQGTKKYLAHYVQPTSLLLPFHVMTEITRTLALAVRLFGNMMSGTLILGILLSIAPFFFPILFNILGLILSLIQAYIFSVLSIVYIAAVSQTVK